MTSMSVYQPAEHQLQSLRELSEVLSSRSARKWGTAAWSVETHRDDYRSCPAQLFFFLRFPQTWTKNMGIVEGIDDCYIYDVMVEVDSGDLSLFAGRAVLQVDFAEHAHESREGNVATYRLETDDPAMVLSWLTNVTGTMTEARAKAAKACGCQMDDSWISSSGVTVTHRSGCPAGDTRRWIWLVDGQAKTGGLHSYRRDWRDRQTGLNTSLGDTLRCWSTVEDWELTVHVETEGFDKQNNCTVYRLIAGSESVLVNLYQDTQEPKEANA